MTKWKLVSLKGSVTHQTLVWVWVISCSNISQNSGNKHLQCIHWHQLSRVIFKRNWSRLCLGVFIGESCSPRVLSSDYFSLTWTTKHQHTRNLLLFFTTFIANLSTALSGSCFAWSFFAYCGFPNIFIHMVSLNSWAQRPRLLPTFKAWLLSTCLIFLGFFFFNAKGISTLWRVSKW